MRTSTFPHRGEGDSPLSTLPISAHHRIGSQRPRARARMHPHTYMHTPKQRCIIIIIIITIAAIIIITIIIVISPFTFLPFYAFLRAHEEAEARRPATAANKFGARDCQTTLFLTISLVVTGTSGRLGRASFGPTLRIAGPRATFTVVTWEKEDSSSERFSPLNHRGTRD